MIIKLILLFLWISTATIEGIRDANYYHEKMNSSKPSKSNIHWIFTVSRGVVLCLICWINSMLFTSLNCIVFVFSLALMFSFIHNGFYFTTRNRLDSGIYPKGWFENSSTSTSRIELTAVSRTAMFAIGVVGIISSIQLK